MSRIEVDRSPERHVLSIHADAGVGDWLVLLILLFPLGAASLVFRHMLKTPAANVYATAGSVVIGALFVATGLGFVLATLWKIFGRETVIVDADKLRVEHAIGWMRYRRTFRLSSVTNIRWRERRVTARRGSYQRRIVSFDADGRTVDLGTYLTFPEATRFEKELENAVQAFRARASPT